MSKCHENKAAKAIQAIDSLPNYKQAPKDKRGILGDHENGFCCLGAMATELEVDFEKLKTHSGELQEVIGLRTPLGEFHGEFYGKQGLAEVNDFTNAGFKRIATFLKRHPDQVFLPEVAEIISKHYLQA